MHLNASSRNGKLSARACANFLAKYFLAADCNRSSAISTPTISSESATLPTVMLLPNPQPRSNTRIGELSYNGFGAYSWPRKCGTGLPWAACYYRKSRHQCAFLRTSHLPTKQIPDTLPKPQLE